MKLLERLSLTRREFIRNMTATGVSIPVVRRVLAANPSQSGGDSTSIWIAQKGSPEPTLLCKMAQDWFKTLPDGNRQATPDHPHSRFLPNGTGLTFSSGGEIYLVEL